MLALGFCLLLLGTAAGCRPAGFAADAVVAKNPRVLAMNPGASSTTAFMTLVNHGPVTQVVGARVNVAARAVALHTHTRDDGVVKTEGVSSLELPRDTPVRLEPGGLHVLLTGVEQPLRTGAAVTIVLDLADGTEVPVLAPVRANASFPN